MTSSQDKIHALARAVIVDDHHLLVCRTLDLPQAFYFLPGGHIEHEESAEKAVVRELQEEAGAECSIKRFLGCLEYGFVPGHNSIVDSKKSQTSSFAPKLQGVVVGHSFIDWNIFESTISAIIMNTILSLKPNRPA